MFSLEKDSPRSSSALSVLSERNATERKIYLVRTRQKDAFHKGQALSLPQPGCWEPSPAGQVKGLN